MNAAELKRWLASVARLTPAQRVELLSSLSAKDDEAEVGQLVDLRLARLPACPPEFDTNRYKLLICIEVASAAATTTRKVERRLLVS